MENLPVVLSNEMQNEINVYASKVIAEMPKVIDNEQNTIYVPVAGVDYPGIAFFNPKHFSIDLYGFVSLLKGGIEKIEKIGSSGLIDTYAIYLTDGRIEYFSVTNGAPGPEGPSGKTPYIKDGYWHIGDKNLGVDARGIEGKQGPKGDGLEFKKIYNSISEMNEGFATDNVPLGGMVLINTNNVNNPDNSKIFIKREDMYHYVNDLSGSTGIQGPMGPTPVRGVDYFTEQDKKEMVDAVISAIPFAEEVGF